jgi:hypothetical protein
MVERISLCFESARWETCLWSVVEKDSGQESPTTSDSDGMPMVWCERQDGLGDLPGLWSILPRTGLDENRETKTSLPMDSGLSGYRCAPGGLDLLSLPA